MTNATDSVAGINEETGDEESGDLMVYDTAEYLRTATPEECRASREAAESDGGAGVITVDGVRCYVEPDPR